MVSLHFIGQAGVVIHDGRDAVVIDPYLSDSVAEMHGQKFRRLLPVPDIAAWAPSVRHILHTHAHPDHTDPASVEMVLSHAPGARICAPLQSRKMLEASVSRPHEQLRPPSESWFEVAPGIRARAVPAAHTGYEREADGSLRFMGFLLEAGGKLIYHAGDTVVHQGIIDAVRTVGEPDIAFLPFNERNYYREKDGIIGNLTVREALTFARDIGARKVIPIHWDMFALNSALPEEIELLKSRLASEIDLTILSCGQRIEL